MYLCEIVVAGQVLVVPTLIPSVSSHALMSSPIVSTTKDTLEIDVPKEDPSEAGNLKSTPSTSSQKNARVGDDWGSLDFTESFVGEHKVNPIYSDLPITSSTPAIKDDYSSVSQDNVSNSCNVLNVRPPPFEEDDHPSVKEANSHVKKDDGDPIEECNPDCWNNALYEDLPPQDLQTCYGFNFKLDSKYGYGHKGCGSNEQGIQVPIECVPRKCNLALGCSNEQLK